MISIIAAIGKNREIGKNGGLIWQLPGDMKYFKEMTLGHKVLMGRKTFESIPGGKGLSGRENIVLSRKNDNTDMVVEKLRELDEEVFVIGGGSIYKMMLPFAERLYLTEIDATDMAADTFFPDFNRDDYERVETGKGSDHGINYVFARYDKK